MKPVLLLEMRAALPRETAWLSVGERERLAQMRFPRRRHDFRRGRWTAKRALARAFGLPEDFASLARLDLRPDHRGAPHAYRDDERLACDVSLSHRAGAAFCAIAALGSRVGCDVEWVEPRSRAFADLFLNPRERRWLAGLEPAARAEAANLLWSAKESAVKGLGTGLDVDLRSIDVRLARGALVVRVPSSDSEHRGRWGRHAGWLWTVVRPS